MTLAELLFGLGALPVGAKKDRLTQALDALLALFPAAFCAARHRCASDQDAAGRYAEMAVTARAAGRPLPTTDGYVAAAAASRSFAVATRNIQRFQATGVDLIDPWQDPRRGV